MPVNDMKNLFVEKSTIKKGTIKCDHKDSSGNSQIESDYGTIPILTCKICGWQYILITKILGTNNG